MFKNYIKTALRNLVRNRVYSIINITGFAIGLTISLLLIFYVKHELSYDEFHEKKDYIYRLGVEQSDGKKTERRDYSLTVMGPAIKEAFPEVKEFTRISSYRGGSLVWKDKGFREHKIRYADSSLFDLFSFKLLRGNKETVLAGPGKIVLSKKLADKIFGDVDPLGETLNYNGKNNLTVSGIIENAPSKSHIKYAALISFETIYSNYSDAQFTWNGGWGYFTYLELNSSAPGKELYTKLDNLFYEKIGKMLEGLGWTIHPLLHPLEDLYLHHDGMDDPASSGNLMNIYIFAAIAIFVLLIASINFMNLTTAQSLKRIKEVGVRKVAGATRKKLVYQFIGESLLITFIAFILAIILIEIFLSQFSQLLGKDLSIYTMENIEILLGLPLLVILVGIMAGSYPAFFLSSYSTSNIFKGGSSTGRNKYRLRNTLIVAQFVISIVLIISSVVIYSQLNYAQNKKLGYNKNNLLSINLESNEVIKKDEVLKSQLLELPEVQNVSIASNYPGLGVSRYGFVPEGSEEPQIFHVLDVDSDYFKTLKIKIIKGRNFRKKRSAETNTCLINETLAEQLNWENPIGKYIERNGKQKIIGVVKDFHFASLHDDIGPLVFRMKKPWQTEKVLVRFSSGNTKESLQKVHTKWNKLFGSKPINYEFVDDSFKEAYKVDIQFSQTILFFTVLAILIACLGLFGLTAFSTEQRTKEIGIRKAMGANVFRINNLIVKQFVRWVLVANIIAWPIAYYFMNKWLQNYAYKIDMHAGYFVSAAIVSVSIALITVSYHSIRAAKTNPVNSLRYE
jgi:putative ABC transport system permease protein